jgi:RHS repeat-associated protein
MQIVENTCGFHPNAPLFADICSKIEPGVFYYTSDHLGSSTVITDSNGDYYEHTEYFPYGEVWVNEKAINEDDYDLPYKYTGKEYDEETKLTYYGHRYFDAQLSRWISVDPPLATGEYLPTGDKKRNANLPGLGGVFNPINLNAYHYAGNNPVKYTDPDGNRVVLRARRLNFTGGGVGVHTYIDIIPDNPKDFGGRTRWTLSGFSNGSQLVTQVNSPTDVNWGLDDLKGSWDIAAPEGKSDTGFIKDIMSSFERYASGSRTYGAFPKVEDFEGNCNTISTGALVGAGVDNNIINAIDPSGANPGLGEFLPEMLPPPPEPELYKYYWGQEGGN